MKRQLFTALMVLMASVAALADVAINSTNFPDANFRSYLLSEYPSGTITTAQLNARTTLNLSSKGIANAKGIEYFTELTRLDLYSNNLTTINVSSNTKLTYLNVGINKLTSITIGTIPTLQELYLQNNLLTTVSVCNHSNLRTLWVQNNPNLTGLYCWRNALTNVSVSGCTALKQLKIYNNYNLTSITGLADCTELTWLDVEDTSFSDLSVVKNMTSLQTLLAGNTRITTLETSHSGSLQNLQVAGDTRLADLRCYSENLTTLKVTGCTALNNLRCYYNSNLAAITGLADCTALIYLDCEDCAIAQLPGVNNMMDLETLWCRNNKLTSLIVTNKPQLHYLRMLGNTGLTELVCNNNALTALDVSGCTNLQDLDCQSNPSLDNISGLTDCTALDWFACDYCAVSSLDMTFCPGLTSLYCYNNQLTELYVTGLTNLQIINCKNNPNLGAITGLADCTKINYLDCSSCGLSNLDLSNMSELQELWCSGNQFTYLGVTNKPILTTLVASDNSQLVDMDCYDCALTELNVFNCDSLEYIDCQNNQLSSLDVSTCPSLAYLLCNLNQLTELDISNNPKLLYLWCNQNQLTSLDLSTCPDGFLSLDCRYNNIGHALDMSRFAQLWQIACSDNQIPQLTLGSHTSLTDIWCAYNQLTSLDVSGCPALKKLDAQSNQLTSLNVTGCTALEILYAHDNQLTSLDASNLSALKALYAQYNNLTSLRVANCPALYMLPMYYNQIQAGQMGKTVNWLPTRSEDDRGSIYVFAGEHPESGRVDGNVMTASQVDQANAKYWDVYRWNWDIEDWEPYTGNTIQRGDVNGDGQVNISDVTALIDLILSGGAFPTQADVNSDGQYNISDVTTLIDMLLGSAANLKKAAPGGDVMEPTMPATGECKMVGPSLDEVRALRLARGI